MDVIMSHNKKKEKASKQTNKNHKVNYIIISYVDRYRGTML